MHKFVLNLITEWRKLGLPFAGETIVAAVSGGADSLSLLLAIDTLREQKKLDLRVIAAHFNHKLRGRESDADEEFVKQIAAERGIELAVGHGSIKTEGNLEQNARNARYKFLAETAERLNARWVLTAHTMNDQAETFLLNLIRGSGPDGLSGMRPIRPMNQESRDESWAMEQSRPLFPNTSPLLARPFLTWAKRENTENFCRETGVEFRYDTMNEDMSFKRVRVRKMLIPMLKEFNPRIVEALAQTSELMRHETENRDPGPTRAVDPEYLVIKELMAVSRSELQQTVRSWLKAKRGGLRSIGLKHIQAIERLAVSTKSGRSIEIPGFGIVRKHGGRLMYENIKVDK